jgi:hypothetical protein
MEEFFSLQKEQLGIIRFIPIKLTQDNWGGKVKLTYASGASSGMDRPLLWA